MKKVAICLLCFVMILSLTACSSGSEESSSNDTSNTQESGGEKMSTAEYDTLSQLFITQFQSLSTQMTTLLASYAGNDDWWNQFAQIYSQAQSAQTHFISNQDRIQDEDVESYNALVSASNSYMAAMNKANEARNASGDQQQQKLNEAAQMVMQATSQWQMVVG